MIGLGVTPWAIWCRSLIASSSLSFALSGDVLVQCQYVVTSGIPMQSRTSPTVCCVSGLLNRPTKLLTEALWAGHKPKGGEGGLSDSKHSFMISSTQASHAETHIT